MTYFIYKVVNLINNKFYIGKSNNPQKRMTSHIWCAKQEKDPKYRQYFQRAIRKYGSENFKLEIIEETDNEKLAFEREVYWILKTNSNNKEIGYNETTGGEGPSGRILSQEVKDNMSAIAKAGFKNGTRVPAMLDKNHSIESKIKMSKIAKENGAGPKPGKSPYAKLNEDIVKQIRIEYQIMTAPQLSLKYNVSIATIKSIVQFRNWKHVK